MMTSNGCRSNLVATSATSSTSRITLVENDPKFIANNELTSCDTDKAIIDHPPRTLWVDRLLAMFCVKSASSKLPIISKEYIKPETLEESETGTSFPSWPSPWILPVHVVSNRQDTDKHPITKIAKCTIDTGNMQGNIVSQEFLEKVLEFPLSSFQKLTKEEERGGTSITGDSHIPQGAVYLTWYHKNSTRVFRDMRFLISSTKHCDLIIGARSIQKEEILNVPCLMAGPEDIVGIIKDDPDKALQLLNRIKKISDDELSEVQKGKVPKKARARGEQKSLTPKLCTMYETQAHVATWTIELYEIFKQHGFLEKTPDQRQNATNNQGKAASEYWKCVYQVYFNVSGEFHEEIHEYLQWLKDQFGYETLEMELKPGGS